MSDTVKGLEFPVNSKGEFVRAKSVFRDWIKADGSTPFPPETNRYHLYVSLACPWASRTLIVRKLKGLENVISYTVVDWLMLEEGWTFTDSKPKCSLDTVNGCKTMREVYKLANPDYDGRITVPVLWDKKAGTIVNNESSDILRMLNSEFNDFCASEGQKKLNLYPQDLRPQIDELNSWIYPSINNGVYKCGFAMTQEAYDVAAKQLFEGLDKCNKKRIVSNYPNLWGFVRDIYQLDGVAETVDPEHIQKHYQMSHRRINPYGIVAIGPDDIDLTAPHDRYTM